MAARLRRPPFALLVCLALLALAPAAHAHGHDPERSGHPLRLVAYALHPIGVIVDTLLLRPGHWLVHKQPLRTLFGHAD